MITDEIYLSSLRIKSLSAVCNVRVLPTLKMTACKKIGRKSALRVKPFRWKVLEPVDLEWGMFERRSKRRYYHHYQNNNKSNDVSTIIVVVVLVNSKLFKRFSEAMVSEEQPPSAAYWRALKRRRFYIALTRMKASCTQSSASVSILVCFAPDFCRYTKTWKSIVHSQLKRQVASRPKTGAALPDVVDQLWVWYMMICFVLGSTNLWIYGYGYDVCWNWSRIQKRVNAFVWLYTALIGIATATDHCPSQF